MKLTKVFTQTGRRWVITILLTLSLLLAGCQTKQPPTLTQSPPHTASPAPTAPAAPTNPPPSETKASFDDLVYTIDLQNPSGTVLPPPTPFLNFIVPPEDSNNDSWLEAVIKINLNDPSINNPYDAVEFQIEYDADPLGMTNVNIGDSQTNNGGGGDGGTQSNDAELNIGRQEGDVKDLFIFAHDNAPSPLLKSVPGFVPGQGSQINVTVKNDFLAWNNNQGISGSLSSPFLYALNGQSDSEGPVNYNIFAAFNRVIAGRYRLGSGVGKVTVRLIKAQ